MYIDCKKPEPDSMNKGKLTMQTPNQTLSDTATATRLRQYFILLDLLSIMKMWNWKVFPTKPTGTSMSIHYVE